MTADEEPEPERDPFASWVLSQITENERGEKTASADLLAYVRRRDMGTPREFDHATIDDFIVGNTGQQKFKQGAIHWVSQCLHPGGKHGLILTGPTGIGKSHLAIAALKKLCRCSMSPQYIDYRRMLEDLRSYSWDFNPVDHWSSMDAILIDEFGSVEATRAQMERFCTILALRANSYAPTILTSNLDFPISWAGSGNQKGQGCLLDDRMISRISGQYIIIQDLHREISDYRVTAQEGRK